MSPNWRWCLQIGAIIVLVDLLTLALSLSAGPDGDTATLLSSVDHLVNIALFSYVGYRTGRETGSISSSAEAGLAASLLPAVAAAVSQVVLPQLGETAAGDQPPLANLVIASVALNVALGGILSLLSGWIASRGRTPVR